MSLCQTWMASERILMLGDQYDSFVSPDKDLLEQEFLFIVERIGFNKLAPQRPLLKLPAY